MVDSPSEHGSSPLASPNILTRPPLATNGHRRNVSAPVASPPASPSVSLHLLGGLPFPFSPLRRQISSSLGRPQPWLSQGSQGPGDSDSNDGLEVDSENAELTQDSRDVLVQRLNDLASRLNNGGEFKAANISSLHAKVDEMERVVRESERKSISISANSLRSPRPGDQDANWGPPTPSWITSGLSSLTLDLPPQPIEDAEKHHQNNQKHLKSDHEYGASKATSLKETAGQPELLAKQRLAQENADQVIREVGQLREELDSVVASVKARAEESEHINEMLLIRAEGAAKRALELEERNEELGNKIDEMELELVSLEIAMKGIEIEAIAKAAHEALPELTQTINDWKSDWTRLQRMKAELRQDGESISNGASSPSKAT